MQIIMKDTSELKAYKNNPRKNDAAVEVVAASIRQFGFKVPVIIDADNVIIAGHTRVKAAALLDMESVPCIVADDLTPEQIKAFRLADNKVSEFAEWDFDILNMELAELADIDFDMSKLGFDIFELDPNMLDADVDDKAHESPDVVIKITFKRKGDFQRIEDDLRSYVDGLDASVFVTGGICAQP